MKTFITSDTHFGHANIIRLTRQGRPFDSVEEMDETLIDLWNEVVGPEDTVWHLGDFAYKGPGPETYFRRLNGHKHLVFGNHDDARTAKLPWRSVQDYAEISHNGRKVVLFHYPILEWHGWYRGAVHFHGHQHNDVALRAPGRLDVGVDANVFRPWLLEDAVAAAANVGPRG